MKLVRFHRPEIWNWSGLNQLTSLRDEINRLFDTNGASDIFNAWTPALDLYENKDNLVLRAELPGMKKEDVDISFHENVVTVSGERKNETRDEGAQTSREERFFGRFTRSLKLSKPVNSAGITAAYKDGILTITLPKSEEAKLRHIKVESN